MATIASDFSTFPPADAPAIAGNDRPVPTSLTQSLLAFLLSPCLYLSHHRWFLALAALDLALTTAILNIGGREANLVPRVIIAFAGLGGMVALKAASVITVLVLCELIGRRREHIGRRLALAAVAANTAAVTLGIAYIAIYHAAAYL